MPKKFVGENSKAVAARQRKEDAKIEKDSKLKKVIEDAAWEDNDDKLKKKQQKKVWNWLPQLLIWSNDWHVSSDSYFILTFVVSKWIVIC